MYKSTKRYGHEIGLSCCFRQHRADSHCKLLHGYALAFKFVFASRELDVRNWVVDFGSLKGLKAILEDTFDHTLLVAEDDPKLVTLRGLQDAGLARVIVMPAVGCEATAHLVYEVAKQWLKDAGYGDRVWLESVEVSEHGANSAIYIKEQRNDVQD
ncbi:6-pyruvoyl tetrahydrobiopterin synthase [Cupriavidus sp. UYMMa02A]|nr:6-pyruvoyl tetrahydrobiopterin synthase [Cupriavidus sp. UYMU48A]ODV43364.1 6-pyruvoyl tetrahydrobiopterin synthase [Cupriavidus sp. UYMMa02A]RWA51036.1 6-pyruvoyl tetrahydrobiopterin synthase [Cupriavidus sp. UYMSc13B]